MLNARHSLLLTSNASASLYDCDAVASRDTADLSSVPPLGSPLEMS